MKKPLLFMTIGILLAIVLVGLLPSRDINQAKAGNEPPPYKTGISSPGSRPIEPPDSALRDAKDVLYFEGKVDWLALKVRSPRTAWEHMQYGMYLQDDLDKVDQAAEEFKTAIQMDVAVTGGIGKILVPHARLGQIALNKGDYDEAIAQFTIVSQMDPILLGAYERIAEAYHGKGDTDKAIQFYNQELALQMGKNQKIMFELAELYKERGDKAQALDFYQKYLNEAQFHSDTYPLRIELVKKEIDELKQSLAQ